MIKMDSYQVAGLIIFLILLLALTGQASDFIKQRSKDRRMETLSDSRLNNRIINVFDNAEYRILSILEQGGGFFDWDGETTEGFNRTQKTFLNCHPSQFKESLLKGLQTGKHVYRFYPKEVIDVSETMPETPTPVPVAISPEYTNEEIERLRKEEHQEKTKLEGEIAKLRASTEESVNSILKHAEDIQSSKYNPNK